MSPERWLQVKAIVNVSLDLEAEQRDAYLQHACQGDSALAHDVTSLLASYDGLGDFLATSVLEPDNEELTAGARVGPYEICEPVADGGMGTVYRAVRASDFEKQVALKVVKRGMDTNFILRRFRHERQILAHLDHPNIARLLDGGATEDGRPYLVMEYIEGRPITVYAEEHRLSVSERLQLFRSVCSAVEYAHQNLVVHRDLKPANILVTSDRVPKLLDFGIAKLLESNVDRTVASIRLMTPECASPEQVLGDAITTATDIYSLGVLLYNLLTGVRPYEFKARTDEEIRHLVCVTDPKKPSAIRPLSEDLDQIVLKAMHKDPARRYLSAAQLSEDLHRFLQGEPVIARADTTWYRAKKFVGRNAKPSAAAAAFALSLIVGMAATSWEAHMVQAERARAERQSNDVRELTNSLLGDVHDAIRALPGSTAARKLLVDRALKYLDGLALEAGTGDSVHRELAVAYARLGEVQGEAGRSNLGDSTGAIRSFRKSVRLFEALHAKGRLSVPDQRILAGIYDSLAIVLLDSGDPAAGDDYVRKALALRRGLARRLPALELARELARSYSAMGLRRALAGDFAAALQYHQQFLDAEEQIAQVDPNSNRRSLAQAHKRVGAVLIKLGRLSDALVHYQTAEAIDQMRVAAAPQSAEARLDLTFASSDIAYILREQGDWRAALAEYRKVEAIRAGIVRLDPKDQRARSALASTSIFIAHILVHAGNHTQSLPYLRKALALNESLLRDDPANPVRQIGVAELSVQLGDEFATVAADSGAAAPAQRNLFWGEARTSYRRAMQLIAALRTRGSLDQKSAALEKQASDQLARCNAALAELSDPGSPTPVSASLTR